MAKPTDIIFDQRAPFELISPPTLDLICAVWRASTQQDGCPADEAAIALDALRHGAVAEPGNIVRHPPLAVVAMHWFLSPDYRRAMMPVAVELAGQASKLVLDKAMALSFGAKHPSHTKPMAKMLQQQGAALDGRCLNSISLLAIGHDAMAAKMVTLAGEMGWKPNDDWHARKFLGSIIETGAAATLDAFVAAYEAAETMLPTRTGDDCKSPVCALYHEQGALKKREKSREQALQRMLLRMLHSGLVVHEQGPNLDWKVHKDPDMIEEAAREGCALRLARTTQSTPARARPRF